jgi:TRAP-type C4-dicarboxylate transport system permease small subunit
MGSLRNIYDRVLEAVAALLIVALALIVVLGFAFRGMGHALSWYDEVASIVLAWLTYYAGALAALRGAHIGFAGFVNAMPPTLRVVLTLAASTITIGFFALLAVTGYQVVSVIAGLTLVALPQVQQSWIASVIPITSVLFVISELFRLPGLLEEARRGPILDREIKEAIGIIDASDEPSGRKDGTP